MKTRIAATIAIDISAASIVVLVGLEMLSFPFNIIWGIFNVVVMGNVSSIDFVG